MQPRKAIAGNRHSEKLKHIKNQITVAPRTCMARPSCPAIRSVPQIMRVRKSAEMIAARGGNFSFSRMRPATAIAGVPANNAWGNAMEFASMKSSNHREGTKAKRVSLSPSWWYVDRLAAASQRSGIITKYSVLGFMFLLSNVRGQGIRHLVALWNRLLCGFIFDVKQSGFATAATWDSAFCKHMGDCGEAHAKCPGLSGAEFVKHGILIEGGSFDFINGHFRQKIAGLLKDLLAVCPFHARKRVCIEKLEGPLRLGESKSNRLSPLQIMFNI